MVGQKGHALWLNHLDEEAGGKPLPSDPPHICLPPWGLPPRGSEELTGHTHPCDCASLLRTAPNSLKLESCLKATCPSCLQGHQE